MEWDKNQTKFKQNILLMRDIWREVADQSERLQRWKGWEKCMRLVKTIRKMYSKKAIMEKKQYPTLHAKPTIQMYKECNLSLTSPWKEGPSKLQNKK
jgi:hypothetical protein